jgi:IMP and pyridine-specific 5'-nucleotidase
LHSDNPVIPHLIELLAQGIHIGIVTAAGYFERHGNEYTRRLNGLLTAVENSELSTTQKGNLAILGGECNYLFRYDGDMNRLVWVDEEDWRLDEMMSWEEDDIKQLLDIAAEALYECATDLHLKFDIMRKPRAVGIPTNPLPLWPS